MCSLFQQYWFGIEFYLQQGVGFDVLVFVEVVVVLMVELVVEDVQVVVLYCQCIGLDQVGVMCQCLQFVGWQVVYQGVLFVVGDVDVFGGVFGQVVGGVFFVQVFYLFFYFGVVEVLVMQCGGWYGVELV